MNIADEINRTKMALRAKVHPHYPFDERWEDFRRCLLLDGYMLETDRIMPIDASSEDQSVLEDGIAQELRRANFENTTEILRLLNNSTEDFRRQPPDYNGCMTNARVALQTLARTIAVLRRTTIPGSFDESVWGQVIAYLRTSGLITAKEEEGVTGVFSFVSSGAHIPVGLNEQEFARLGRVFVFGMCFFLLKRFNR